MTTPSTSGQTAALAWPTLRKAAKMLGVNASTLSRRPVPAEAVGRERRVRPSVVLTEAAYHNKRPLDEVGYELIEHARKNAPAFVPDVEAEVDGFFEAYHPSAPDRERWLEEARQFLPPELFARVSSALEGADPTPSDGDTEEHDAVVVQRS
jgi:hypothetical protein